MKLRKYNKDKALSKLSNKNNKKLKIGTIICSICLLVGAIIYFSFARFEATESFNLINGTAADSGDYVIAAYVDGTRVGDFPEPSDNVSFDSITCNNNADAYFDEGSWSAVVNTTKSNTRCSVNFKTNNNKWQLPGGVDLYNGMVPIVFDGNTIKVANTSSKWYDYNNHEWANAALVTSSARSKSAGSTLDMSEILQMYVWIPRYAYKTWDKTSNQSNEQIINIKFMSSTQRDIAGYVTHPAFKFGNTELNGFWVGKFEPSATTGIWTATDNSFCTSIGCANAANLRIIPNTISLTNINVANEFNASRTIESNSTFGLTASQVDTHMMKNTEWGAVAYLSQSRYGIFNYDGTCANESQAADSTCKVFINNINVGYGNDTNSNSLSFQWGPTVTGCSAAGANTAVSNTHNQTNPTCANNYTWNANGVLASTTGNKTGVYDMSGGAWEYVAGNMANSTTTYTYNAKYSELSTQPEDKYLDHYLAIATDTTTMSDDNQSKVQNRGILGDATSEVIKTYGNLQGGWNSDYAYFVSSSLPWFRRGGHALNGAGAGVFAFGRDYGGRDTRNSFRVVLSAQ